MVGLLTFGSGLMSRGGTLMVGNDCCCDGYYSDCPPCCAQVQGGFLDPSTGEITYEVSAGAYTLTVVLGGVNENGYVCDGDTVTVDATLTVPVDGNGDDDDSLGPNHYPRTSWDQAWLYGNHTPSIGTGGHVREHGEVYWGDSETLKTSVSLTYTHCWNNRGQQFGDITVAFENPDLVVNITLDTCPGNIDCCKPTIECKKCCYYLDDDEFEVIDGKLVAWDTSGDYAMRVELSGIDTKTRVICIDEGVQVDATITIIPASDAPDPYTPDLCVSGDNWEITSHSPAIPGLVTDPPPSSICWPDDEEALEYSVTFELNGCQPPGDLTFSTSDPGMSVSAVFTECDEGIECCCCPGYCHCDCYYPLGDPDVYCGSDNTLTPLQKAQQSIAKIENFEWTLKINNSSNFPLCFINGNDGLQEVTAYQDGPSEAAWQCNECDDDLDCPQLVQWTVPLRQDCSSNGGFERTYTATVTPVCTDTGFELRCTINGNPYQIGQLESTSCDTFDESKNVPIAPPVTYDHTVTFDVTGSESCPDNGDPAI